VRLEELDIRIPPGSIAQEPAEPRDSCRLMYLDRLGVAGHHVFSDLPSLLRRGDTLVINDSRVLPARLRAVKDTGGKVELLFLRPVEKAAVGLAAGERTGETWEILARPSHRLRPGSVLCLPDGSRLILSQLLGEGRWLGEHPTGGPLAVLLEECGEVPLPPYIKHYPRDPSSYQTVYACEPGSAAAPTAGLHFSEALLARLSSLGIVVAPVTLHVGLDTFQPIRTPLVEQHRIHRESYAVSQDALATIRETSRAGGRLVAVGTTAARVLETLAADGVLEGSEPAAAVSGMADLFITPGYKFRAVQLLLTNFHLPRSTVLAMVMAFAGTDRIRSSYAVAAERGYRFFSFGDAILIEAPFEEGSVGRLPPKERSAH
jgi:S-adenosylmethionine:tRNA ribosyltransferase-isomerase